MSGLAWLLLIVVVLAGSVAEVATWVLLWSHSRRSTVLAMSRRKRKRKLRADRKRRLKLIP